MTRIAFVFPEDERWTGGVNYLHNLLFALDSVGKHDLEPILFVGDQVDENVLKRFHGLAHIVRDRLFNRFSLVNKSRRVISRLTGKDYCAIRFFVRQRIDVASHCNLAGSNLPFRTINWIPDFQHLYLPELFLPSEIARRDRKYRQWLCTSDLMLFSSEDACRDAQRMAPDAIARMRVLHFVSQTNPDIYELNDCQPLCRKYVLPEKFFYLPNQFWVHKNHRVVIEAVNELNREGCKVHVVCTGYTGDLKSSGYLEELDSLIDQKGVRGQFHILGMIDYEDVQTLLRHCISVINPSLFEGWSSTVEEAKSVGKNILLSDLPVHREQDPPRGAYFDPRDPVALACLLREKWQAGSGGPDLEMERVARQQLPVRTQEFGEAYQRIVSAALGSLS